MTGKTGHQGNNCSEDRDLRILSVHHGHDGPRRSPEPTDIHGKCSGGHRHEGGRWMKWIVRKEREADGRYARFARHVLAELADEVCADRFEHGNALFDCPHETVPVEFPSAPCPAHK